VVACSAESPDGPDPRYADVQRVLHESCGKAVCHGSMAQNAHLDLERQDARAALVDVPACEYDRMPRVRPFDPEHSWLMRKIAGPTRFRGYADFVELTPDPDWRPGAPECSGQLDDGSPWFGLHMPPPDSTLLGAADIALLRDWIADGARGL
jgi:hypothetical protein